MNAIELRQQVLQEVVSLMDDDVAMMRLQSFLSTLKNEEGFERIPGLPYTKEERKADLIAAEKEIAAGNVIAWEDLKKEMETW